MQSHYTVRALHKPNTYPSAEDQDNFLKTGSVLSSLE